MLQPGTQHSPWKVTAIPCQHLPEGLSLAAVTELPKAVCSQALDTAPGKCWAGNASQPAPERLSLATLKAASGRLQPCTQHAPDKCWSGIRSRSALSGGVPHEWLQPA